MSNFYETEKSEYGTLSRVRKCPVCGKRFFIYDPSDWAYKRVGKHITYVCSWTCLREYDRQHGGTPKKRLTS